MTLHKQIEVLEKILGHGYAKSDANELIEFKKHLESLRVSHLDLFALLSDLNLINRNSGKDILKPSELVEVSESLNERLQSAYSQGVQKNKKTKSDIEDSVFQGLNAEFEFDFKGKVKNDLDDYYLNSTKYKKLVFLKWFGNFLNHIMIAAISITPIFFGGCLLLRMHLWEDYSKLAEVYQNIKYFNEPIHESFLQDLKSLMAEITSYQYSLIASIILIVSGVLAFCTSMVVLHVYQARIKK